MPTSKELAREVEALALTVTGYETGKSGQNGLCDCIGLVMGAMTNLGRGSYPMHSTNYFARYQMDSLRILSDAELLSAGQLVYKANNDQSDLNDRYKQGGRYYTGDLLNYYHVGVVTDVNPLEITHCTSIGGISGIKRDSTIKGWTHVGEVRGVDYARSTGTQIEEAKNMAQAVVSASNGKPVRMRKMPGTDAPTLAKLDVGTVVDVVEQAGEWSTIIAPNGTRGYMMSSFLALAEAPSESAPAEQEPSRRAEFEETVIAQLDRIEMLLNVILDGEEGAG